jgi:hypothetical protein
MQLVPVRETLPIGKALPRARKTPLQNFGNLCGLRMAAT